MGLGVGGGDQADALVVERVDQVDEAAGLVSLGGESLGMPEIMTVWKAWAIAR